MAGKWCTGDKDLKSEDRRDEEPQGGQCSRQDRRQVHPHRGRHKRPKGVVIDHEYYNQKLEVDEHMLACASMSSSRLSTRTASWDARGCTPSSGPAALKRARGAN